MRQQRHAEIALDPRLGLRVFFLDAARVEAKAALDDLRAGRVRQLILDVGHELAVRPERQRGDVLRRDELGDEAWRAAVAFARCSTRVWKNASPMALAVPSAMARSAADSSPRSCGSLGGLALPIPDSTIDSP